MAPFLPVFVQKFTNMSSEIPQILPHCALPSGIDVYLSHDGHMVPPWGRQISESVKNAENGSLSAMFLPIDSQTIPHKSPGNCPIVPYQVELMYF